MRGRTHAGLATGSHRSAAFRAVVATSRSLACGAVAFGVAACGTIGDGGEPPSNDLPAWHVSEDPTLSVGELDGDAAYVLSRVADVALLDRGEVAVADGGSSTVRVYDADGSMRRVSGGPGEGPGEYAWMTDLRFLPPDTLVVYGAERGRLTTLVDDGARVVSTTTFRGEDGRTEVYLGRFAEGSHAVAWLRQAGSRRAVDEATPDRWGIGRFDPDGGQISTLTDDVGMRRLGRGPTPFSPHFVGVVVGGTAFHGDGLLPRIRRTAPSGAPAEPLTVDLPSATLDDAWAAYQAVADSADLAGFAEIRGAPVLDSVPAFSHMLADDVGRIWLKAYDPTTDSHWRLRQLTGGSWLVVEPDGAAVARVSVPQGFRLMDVRGDAVAGVSRDELGVERVEVRRLERSTVR